MDVAVLLGTYRQSTSTTPSIEGRMNRLLACGKALGRLPYLSEQEKQEVRRVLTDSIPTEKGMEPETY